MAVSALNFHRPFYEALLKRQGCGFLVLGLQRSGKGGRKAQLHHQNSVQCKFAGRQAYTSLLDLKPGDEFEIKLGRKQIRLVPFGAEEEDE